MYLKLMGDENAPDGDSRKAHRILSNVASVNFVRCRTPDDGPEVGCFAFVVYEPSTGFDREKFELVGNVYVMNDRGDTIDQFRPTLVDFLAENDYPFRNPKSPGTPAPPASG